MSQSSGKLVSDITIVAGLGLAQFRDDDMTVDEPSAASTAGQKTTRNDLLEKRCAEYMTKLESKAELATRAPKPHAWPEESGFTPVSWPELGPVDRVNTQATVVIDTLHASQGFGPVTVVQNTELAPVSLAGGTTAQRRSQTTVQRQCSSNSSARTALHEPQGRATCPIAVIGDCQTKDFSTDDLGSFSSALREISPPKSFTQRLWEAKSRPRQAGGVQTASTRQESSSRCSGSEAESPQQQTQCYSHPQMSTACDITAAQRRTVGSVEEESLNGELLSSSVLRCRPDDTSETWLLQRPGDSELQHTTSSTQRAFSLRTSSLHRPTLTPEDGEAADWTAPQHFNCTPNDMFWNCPALGTSSPACDGMFDASTEAAKLAALMADEEFGVLDMDELEEDERLCDTLAHAEVMTSLASDTAAHFTGICEVDEITIRESWLGSSVEGVRRVPVDEYLQAGSLALGSLSGNCKRPSFGIHSSMPSSVHSTPRLSLVKETETSITDSNTIFKPQTMRSAAQGPLEPAAKGPTEPATQRPTEPAAQRPTEPAAQGLAEPAAQGLAEPAAQRHTEPAAQRHTEPAAQRHTEPAAQRHTEPAAQRHTEPAAQRHTEPAAQRHTEPAAQRLTEPSAQRPTEPSAQRPTEPAAPRPTEPAAPRPTESAAPRPTESAAPRPTEPAAPRPTEPAAPRPTEPAAQRPIPPAAKEPLRPAAQTPIESAEDDCQQNAWDECAQRERQTPVFEGRDVPRECYSHPIAATENRPQNAGVASSLGRELPPTELVSCGRGMRSRGDGGSMSNSIGEKDVPHSLERTHRPPVLRRSATSTATDAVLHSSSDSSSAQSCRLALKKSFSVNSVDSGKSGVSDVVPVAGHYGSLGRNTTAAAASAHCGWLPQSRSDADVSRAGLGPDLLRRQAARRGVDAVKAAISNMRENVSPNTARSVVMEAMMEDPLSSVNATLQESVLDASIEIDLLRKQKEAIKNKMSKQPSLVSKQAKYNPSMPRKAALVESKSFPVVGRSEESRLATSSYSQVVRAAPSSSTGFVHDTDEAREDGVANAIPSPYECDEYTELDDTVRLEPCVPSYTLQSSICDATHEQEHLELEETPALHSLTLCEEPSASAMSSASKRVSEPVNVEGCVVGVTTWLSVPLYNPTHDPIRMLAKVASETLNNRLVTNSSLIYKQSCVILQPRQNLVWALGICARGEGVLRCSLELQLLHGASQRPLLTHVVPITASATLLQVTIGNAMPLEVGCVPEGFSYEAQFEVHNNSGRELAVVLSLSQVFSAPVFRLVPSQDARVLSPCEIACTLKAGTNTFTMSITVPNLCNVGGESKDSLKISCKLLVKLDSSDLPRPMLASETVNVDVVAVHLHISRSCMPLKLQAAVDLHASAPLTLKNLSCIPLSLKLRCDFAEEHTSNANVAIVPDHFMIQPNMLASPVVVFTPLGVVTHFTATVVIVVEPYGLEYEVPVEALSVLEEKLSDNNQEGKLLPNRENNKVTYSSSLDTCQSTRPPAKVSLMNPIEASKSRLVFGCLKCGITGQQKLSFYNRNNTNVVLSFGITGSKSFSVVDPEQNNSVVVPADGTAVILVAFSPTSDGPHSGMLVCKPRGLQQHRVKYSIQLQGYGGCGELRMADTLLQLPAVSTGSPAIVRLALSNAGTRTLCVAISSYADVECSTRVESVMVLPEELLLPAACCQDVVVVVPCLPDGGGSEEGNTCKSRKLGCLLVRYTEEVLRRRYRNRLVSGCSKALAASKSSPTDWDAAFRSEKLTAQEEDGGLPSCPDDTKVFFSSFRQVKVPVLHSAPLYNSDEASVTCFSPLSVDYTLSDSTLPPPDHRLSGWPSHRANIPFPPAGVDVNRNLNGPNQEAHINKDDAPSRENEYRNKAIQQPYALNTETSRSQLGSVMEENLLQSASNDLNKPNRHDSEEYVVNMDQHSSVQEKDKKCLPNHAVSTRVKPLLGTTALNRGTRSDKIAAPAGPSQASDRNNENNLSDCDPRESNFLEVHGSRNVNKNNNYSSHGEDATEVRHGSGRQVLSRRSANTMRPPRAVELESAGTESECSAHPDKEEADGVNKTFQRIEAVTSNDQPDNDVENKENYMMHKNRCEAIETTAAPARGSVEVFPPELSVEAGGAAAVVVVNKTELRRTLHVSCSHSCLVVEPVVATVGPQGSVSVRLTLQQRLHYTTQASLTVKCNGHESVVKVTCLPYLQSTLSSERLNVAGLQVGQSALSFPITSAGKQAHVKLSLKNLSTTTKQVLASVVSGGGSFVVKHPHFQVKVGHFVNVPVYFRPRYAGDHEGGLRLAVGGEGEVNVQLTGSCV